MSGQFRRAVVRVCHPFNFFKVKQMGILPQINEVVIQDKTGTIYIFDLTSD
jgi:hypothetical protein